MNEVLIVAAEASSALFALRLLEQWKSEKKNIKAFGVGTQAMEDLGFERIGKAEEMAVVGLAEIIEHYGHLKSVFNRLVEESLRRKPKVAIVMDYPDFNLMLAKKLHAAGIPVVYYISPQVWAWRKGRVKKIKKYCEKVLVLFPFEVDFYKSEDVSVEFVGHPLLDEISDKYLNPQYLKERRSKFGIKSEDTVIGLMPGSRRGEIRQHLVLQMQVAQNLSTEFSNLKFAILVAPTLTKEQIQELIPPQFSFSYVLLKDEPPEIICLCDFVLAASGTATLLVGLLHKPMVIMYNVKWTTYVLAKILAYRVKLVGLPNLILGREVVPERIQVGAEALTLEMKKYLQDKAYSDSVRWELSQLQGRLGAKGATSRVAKAVDVYFS